MACKSCKCKKPKPDSLPENTIEVRPKEKKKERVDQVQKALRRLRKAAVQAGVRK